MGLRLQITLLLDSNLEELVLQHLLYGGSFEGIRVEHQSNQVLDYLTEILPDCVPARLNEFLKLDHGLGLKRHLKMEDFVENYSKTPNVHLLICHQKFLIEGFRSHVGLFAHECLPQTEGVLVLTPSEVTDFRNSILGHKDVRGLQIHMDQVEGVEVFDGLADSGEEKLGLIEGEGFLLGFQELLKILRTKLQN